MTFSGTSPAPHLLAASSGGVHGFDQVEASGSREVSEGTLAGFRHRMVYDVAEDDFFVERSSEKGWARCPAEQEETVILTLGRVLEDRYDTADASVHPMLSHLHLRRMALAETHADGFERGVLMPVLSQPDVSDGVLVEILRQLMQLDWSVRHALFQRLEPLYEELERRRGEPFGWNEEGPGQPLGRFFVLFQGAHLGALPFPCDEAALLVALALTDI